MSVLEQFVTPQYPDEIRQLANNLENIVSMYQLGQLSQIEYDELIGDMCDAEKVLEHVHDVELKKAMFEMLKDVISIVKNVVPL